MEVSGLGVLAVLAAGLAAAGAVRWAVVVARPDEWLLRVRNGRMVDAGVGIVLWRAPWDRVVRFTSTLQRVGFAVEAMAADRLRVAIEGFVFWQVGTEGDEPFRAFQRMGIVNLDEAAHELKSPRHLLTSPQHKAFQLILAAVVQRLAGTKALAALLARQDEFVAELRERLGATEAELGIRIEQVELVKVRPAEEALVKDLAAEVEAAVKDEAARSRLEAAERARKRELESAARLGQDEAAARRQALEREHALKLAGLEKEREAELRRLAIAHEKAREEQARALELARGAAERRELELAEALAKVRREAEARRDATLALAAAEEAKSAPVRDHELARLVAERTAEAFGKLPLKEARWVTVGGESPAGSLLGLIRTVREGLGGDHDPRPAAAGRGEDGAEAA